MERRLKVVTEKEQEEFGPILKVEYMSEDEDDTDEEGWRHMELSWRSNDITQFLRTLDNRITETKKEFMQERTKRTSTRISSNSLPKDAPAWAVKQFLPTEHDNHSTSGARGGSALRAQRGRGGRTRRGVRRSITYFANNVLSSLIE